MHIEIKFLLKKIRNAQIKDWFSVRDLKNLQVVNENERDVIVMSKLEMLVANEFLKVVEEVPRKYKIAEN